MLLHPPPNNASPVTMKNVFISLFLSIVLRVLTVYVYFLTLAVVSMFTLPVVYVKHQVSFRWGQTFVGNFDLVVLGCAHDFFLFIGTD